MGPDLVAYAAAVTGCKPFAITCCSRDSNAGAGPSSSITTANAFAFPNAITSAATDLWRAS
jgi:hypothetical protein